MTRKFDIDTWVAEPHRAQAYDINSHYFTIDTAEPEDVYDWVNHNRLMVTYALDDTQTVQGFFNLMPLTEEAGLDFENNRLREEDLTTDHILPPEFMQYCSYLYFPAIAVRNYKTYAACQCTAALMSALATHIKGMYDTQKLKRIFTNPTTFQGNRMVHKLGLFPLRGHKKPLTGSDVYAYSITPDFVDNLTKLEARYQSLIGMNCWIDQSAWRAKLAAKQAQSQKII